MHTHYADEELGRLAASQQGVVSLAQLRAIGLSKDAIYTRTRSGRLHRLYRGVYAVGHTALTPRARELAAVLACGDDAALSERSAGFAWALVRRPPRKIHVTCGRSRPPAPGVIVHRSRLDEEDRVRLDGVPVTTLARTLVDLADVLPAHRLSDAVHEAEVQRRFDLAEVEAVLARMPGRAGRHKLNRVLEQWRPRPFTRSDAEYLFLAFCKRHRLPRPRVNTWIGEQEVDFAWPAYNLAVEVDDAATHYTRRAFEEDRRRDRRLAVKGIQVLRVTWRDLHGDEAELAAELKAVLAAPPASFD